MKKLLFLLGIGGLLLAGCGNAAQPPAVVEVMVVVTATPTAEPTVTPEPVLSVIPVSEACHKATADEIVPRTSWIVVAIHRYLDKGIREGVHIRQNVYWFAVYPATDQMPLPEAKLAVPDHIIAYICDDEVNAATKFFRDIASQDRICTYLDEEMPSDMFDPTVVQVFFDGEDALAQYHCGK